MSRLAGIVRDRSILQPLVAVRSHGQWNGRVNRTKIGPDSDSKLGSRGGTGPEYQPNVPCVGVKPRERHRSSSDGAGEVGVHVERSRARYVADLAACVEVLRMAPTSWKLRSG